MNNIDCIKCEYSRPFNDQDGRNYLGCRYGLGQHQCVWIAQINTCPKEQKEKLQEIHETKLCLLDCINRASRYAQTLSDTFGNMKDKNNTIRFSTTRDILHDLEENIRNAKIDSK